VRRASHLVVTLPNAAQRAAVVTASRSLSESVRIVVRAHYLREREELERSGASAAVFEEAEAAVALARLVLADTGIHRQAVERKLRDIRLQLITDNFATIRSQRVASVMIPWARVRWLSSSASEHAVLEQIAQERFSRWPVVDPRTRRPVGYLLAKDLIARTGDADWTSLIRPLESVHPDESVDATLTRMQEESASLYLIEDVRVILGLITLEDILEQVVGQLEDEDEHDKPLLLADAIALGGIVSEIEASTRDASIHELVSAIPSSRLPVGIDGACVAALAQAREEEISTDLGNGIAIPHARCPGLAAPLVVMGRSRDGVLYSTPESVPVHLFFLMVTPDERPECQLALLRQVARLADKQEQRESLMNAVTQAELLEIIGKSMPRRVG
jgi:mannitol/fructose-specific phosphotransferase system IIA component (Ntr-type)/predicted transcriptional regulator